MERFSSKMGFKLGMRQIADKAGADYHTVSRLLKAGPPAPGAATRKSAHNAEILNTFNEMLDERQKELLAEIQQITEYKPVLDQWKRQLLN